MKTLFFVSLLIVCNSAMSWRFFSPSYLCMLACTAYSGLGKDQDAASYTCKLVSFQKPRMLGDMPILTWSCKYNKPPGKVETDFFAYDQGIANKYSAYMNSYCPKRTKIKYVIDRQHLKRAKKRHELESCVEKLPTHNDKDKFNCILMGIKKTHHFDDEPFFDFKCEYLPANKKAKPSKCFDINFVVENTSYEALLSKKHKKDIHRITEIARNYATTKFLKENCDDINREKKPKKNIKIKYHTHDKF